MRLIDADALDAEMYHKSFEVDDGRNVWHSGLWIRYKIFEEAIRDAQTVDAVPVRHGKWIDEGYYADNTNVKAWHCSECNWHMLGYGDELFRFCPSCGAKMDAERRTDEAD